MDENNIQVLLNVLPTVTQCCQWFHITPLIYNKPKKCSNAPANTGEKDSKQININYSGFIMFNKEENLLSG